MAARGSLRIGLVGLDTSHALKFAEILNDPTSTVGASVVAAFPGGSPDMEKSISRVAGFREALKTRLGVAMMDSPEEVAERVDLVIITAVDGRTHPDLLRRTLPYRRPTFVDKPFALSSEAARRMLDEAQAAGVAVSSSSALRFADPFVEALADSAGGELVGVEAYGPLEWEATQPGYFWYGIHGLEMLVAALGPAIDSVQIHRGDGAEVVVATWKDGRVGTFRGGWRGHRRFGALLHRAAGPRHVDASGGDRPFYAAMLERIVATSPSGAPLVPREQVMAVVRFIEAANESRRSGAAVRLVGDRETPA